MDDHFLSPRTVLARARQQIDELRDIKLDAGTQPKQWVRHVSPVFSVAMLHVSKVPYSAGAIAKDTLNNMRSALDQTGYASAVTLKSAKLGQTKFPFGDTENEAKGDAVRRSRDLHPDIVAVMLGFRPWQEGNELLWNLNRARNVKEHRVLIPVGLGTTMERFKYRSSIPNHSLRPFWSEKDHAICFPLMGDGRSEVRVKFDLHLGDLGTLAGQPAIATLSAMASEVENIIEAVERKSLELI